MAQITHNQTDPASLALAQDPTARGTGIFLVPDFDSRDAEATRKEFVADISYPECETRGQLAAAFRWVPATVASMADLQAQTCGDTCVLRCAKHGCMCKNGLCE